MKIYMIITLLHVQSVCMSMDQIVKATHRKSTEKTLKRTEPITINRSTEIPVLSRKSQSLSPKYNTSAEKFSPNIYWAHEFGYLNEVASSPNDLYNTGR